MLVRRIGHMLAAVLFVFLAELVEGDQRLTGLLRGAVGVRVRQMGLTLATLLLLVRLVAVGLDSRRRGGRVAAVTVSSQLAAGFKVNWGVERFGVDTRKPRISSDAAALPWTRRCRDGKEFKLKILRLENIFNSLRNCDAMTMFFRSTGLIPGFGITLQLLLIPVAAVIVFTRS